MTADLNPSEEQRQIVELVQNALADKFPLSRFRATECRGGFDDDTLAEIAELGWMGIGINEGFGGAGFGLIEEVLLFRELGGHLVTPNAMAGSLAAHLALVCGRHELAADFVAGKHTVCVASPLTGPLATRAGHTHALFDAGRASYALYWSGSEIACVPTQSIASLEEASCVDRTVSMSRAVIEDPGELVLRAGDSFALIRRADLLVAAQLLGLAQAALELAVEYAKVRRQFGQPIGSFQAIKHRCSDMKVRTKILYSLLAMAALCESEAREDAAVQIEAATLLARRYALENAAAGIQIHGAMGFTAECDARLFLLRTLLLRNLGATEADRQRALVSMPMRQEERSVAQ